MEGRVSIFIHSTFDCQYLLHELSGSICECFCLILALLNLGRLWREECVLRIVDCDCFAFHYTFSNMSVPVFVFPVSVSVSEPLHAFCCYILIILLVPTLYLSSIASVGNRTLY